MPTPLFNLFPPQLRFLENRLTYEKPAAEAVTSSIPAMPTTVPAPSEGAKSNNTQESTPNASEETNSEDAEGEDLEKEKNKAAEAAKEKEKALEGDVEAARQAAEKVADQLDDFIKNSAVDFSPLQDECREMAKEYVKGTYNDMIEHVLGILKDCGFDMAQNLEPEEGSWGLQLWINRCQQSVKVDKKCGSQTLNGCADAIDFVKGKKEKEPEKEILPHDFTPTEMEKIAEMGSARSELKDVDWNPESEVWADLWNFAKEVGIKPKAVRLGFLVDSYADHIKEKKESNPEFRQAHQEEIRTFAENQEQFQSLDLTDESPIWKELWKAKRELNIDLDNPKAEDLGLLFDRYLKNEKEKSEKAKEFSKIQDALAAVGLPNDQATVEEVYAYQKELLNNPIDKVSANDIDFVLEMYLDLDTTITKLVEIQGHHFNSDEQSIITGRLESEKIEVDKAKWESLWGIAQKNKTDFGNSASVDKLFNDFKSTLALTNEPSPVVASSEPTNLETPANS